MTTAHRPTWHAALGESSDYGNWSSGGKVSSQFSAKDLPSHTSLKYRQGHQLPTRQSKVDVADDEDVAATRAREAQERKVLADPTPSALASTVPLALASSEVDVKKLKSKYDDEDDENEDSDLDTSSDEDDDDDDEQLLQQELEKIKQERQEAKKRQEEEEMMLAAQQKGAAALSSNPLLNLDGSSAQVKRKWNDDVVFKNQARSEPDAKKRFVNDTIRNDFHRKFLSKYIK